MTLPARVGKRAIHVEKKADLTLVTGFGFFEGRVNLRCRALELIEHALDGNGADRCTAGMQEDTHARTIDGRCCCSSAQILEQRRSGRGDVLLGGMRSRLRNVAAESGRDLRGDRLSRIRLEQHPHDGGA